jgi:hypothetical protein
MMKENHQKYIKRDAWKKWFPFFKRFHLLCAVSTKCKQTSLRKWLFRRRVICEKNKTQENTDATQLKTKKNHVPVNPSIL